MAERMAVMMEKRWVVSKEGHLVEMMAEMMAAGKVALTVDKMVAWMVVEKVALLDEATAAE